MWITFIFSCEVILTCGETSTVGFRQQGIFYRKISMGPNSIFCEKLDKTRGFCAMPPKNAGTGFTAVGGPGVREPAVDNPVFFLTLHPLFINLHR